MTKDRKEEQEKTKRRIEETVSKVTINKKIRLGLENTN